MICRVILCRTLNRIQSRIYPTAFSSNENVLVSAPTGAGKTNIAMIAVLREVGNNMTGCMIDKVCAEPDVNFRVRCSRC